MKNILDETENFLLTSKAENVEILNKNTGEVFAAGDHYGDPTCGAISADERWYISGGEGLIFSAFSGERICAFRGAKRCTLMEKFEIQSEGGTDWLNSKNADDTFFVHALKVENSDRIRILLDPWSEYASVWLLEIANRRLTKLRIGPVLRDQPWRQTVNF